MIDPARGLCVYQSQNCYHSLGKWFVAHGNPDPLYEDYVNTPFDSREEAEAIMKKLLLDESITAVALLKENARLRVALEMIACGSCVLPADRIASDAIAACRGV